MRGTGTILGLAVGAGVGVIATMFFLGSPRPVGAASSDRYGEYVMATGAVSINPRVQTDGVWMLDYRSGKLLGTVIDKTQGKIVGWAEVDLTAEFNVKAFQDVHFMMTTGYVTQGQSALYVAETSTGKFGVYTMGPGANGQGIVIRRHDQTSFRNVVPTEQPIANPNPAVPGAPLVPGLPIPVTPPVLGMPAPITPPIAPLPLQPIAPSLIPTAPTPEAPTPNAKPLPTPGLPLTPAPSMPPITPPKR